jgi:hypothetical protein
VKHDDERPANGGDDQNGLDEVEGLAIGSHGSFLLRDIFCRGEEERLCASMFMHKGAKLRQNRAERRVTRHCP